MPAQKNNNNAHSIPFDDPLIAAGIANSGFFLAIKNTSYSFSSNVVVIIANLCENFTPKKNTHTHNVYVIKNKNNSTKKNDDVNIRTHAHTHIYTKSSFNKTIIEYQPSANRFLCKLSLQIHLIYVFVRACAFVVAFFLFELQN